MPSKRKPDQISQEDWDAVDSPELSEEMIRSMRPASETHPDFVAAWQRTRGKQKAPTKQQITIRLDRDVIEHFKKGGRGWQTRLNKVLRDAVLD